MAKPLLVAGPCAAESEIQVLETARQIISFLEGTPFQLSYFRAGAWKPRSKPGQFDGAGQDALPWLQQVQEELGLKVCVEVARPEHLLLCEQYGIKAVWIGTRTTVNPFLVDELAAALRGKEFTVMIKNPITPDLKLWLGAIERMQNAGVKELIAVHRGVPEPGARLFRNAPIWDMPIELKVQMPDIPLLCDASHIAGDRRYLREISQLALDFGFNGLMLETHCTPSRALSDAHQQITPEELLSLLESLAFKKSITTPEEEKLRKQRHLIEHIDHQISRLFRKRMEVVDEIAKIKLKNNLPIVDTKQFKKVMECYLNDELEDDSREFIKQYLELLHHYSIQRQQKHE